jgi:hypothetical protein
MPHMQQQTVWNPIRHSARMGSACGRVGGAGDLEASSVFLQKPNEWLEPSCPETKEKSEKSSPRRVTHQEDLSAPPAGPHARPDLINRDLTPGTGVLPDPDSDDPNLQPTS